jgi:HEAT repeat protein
MVTLDFLTFIREVAFRVMITLFGIVALFFIATLSAQIIKTIIIKIKALTKRKIYDLLYQYMLEQLPLEDITFKIHQRDTVIQGFAVIIASIIGGKQERMKSAVEALGLIKILEKWLTRIFAVKRIRACHLLGLIKSQSSVSVLSQALFDRNPKVTSAAIIALGELKDENTVSTILEFFSKSSFSQAWLVAGILPSIGSQSYTHIQPYFKSNNLSPEKLILLIKVCAHFRLPESFRDMKTLYDTSDNLDVQINALNVIGKINDLFAVKTVFDALQNSEWQFRAVACRIIGEMSLKGAAYRLIPLLKDKNWFVRKNAAQALVKLGKLGIMTLLAYLDIDDRYARDMIIQTLEENGIVETAVRNLTAHDENEKKEALKIIRTVIGKGYREYLNNFRSSNEIVEKMLAESTNG